MLQPYFSSIIQILIKFGIPLGSWINIQTDFALILHFVGSMLTLIIRCFRIIGAIKQCFAAYYQSAVFDKTLSPFTQMIHHPLLHLQEYSPVGGRGGKVSRFSRIDAKIEQLFFPRTEKPFVRLREIYENYPSITIPYRCPWLSLPGESLSENVRPTDCRRLHCRTRPGRASCRKADHPDRSPTRCW